MRFNLRVNNGLTYQIQLLHPIRVSSLLTSSSKDLEHPIYWQQAILRTAKYRIVPLSLQPSSFREQYYYWSQDLLKRDLYCNEHTKSDSCEVKPSILLDFMIISFAK